MSNIRSDLAKIGLISSALSCSLEVPGLGFRPKHLLRSSIRYLTPAVTAAGLPMPR